MDCLRKSILLMPTENSCHKFFESVLDISMANSVYTTQTSALTLTCLAGYLSAIVCTRHLNELVVVLHNS